MVEFDDVYGWLNEFETESYLSGPVLRLTEHLKLSLKQGNIPQIHYYIDVVTRVSQTLNATKEPGQKTIEYAEVNLECARAYYLMGDITRSVQRFRKSQSLYRSQHPHNTAVTLWLLGCAFWRRSDISDAIAIWERACNNFEVIMKRSRHAEWYKSHLSEMCKTLQLAIDKGYWPL